MKNFLKTSAIVLTGALLMTAVGATAQTTYTATVKEGTEDAANWSADPNPAGEGQGVTIKYNGKKKVKIVTAAQKNLRPLAVATTADLGKIAGGDGNIYNTKAAAEAAGTQAVAMIAYVGSETDNAAYKHGLAIALADEDGLTDWSTAESICEAKNTSTGVANAAWMLPSKDQWKAMFNANDYEGWYNGLNTALATAGGDSSQLPMFANYWSSTPYGNKDYAWHVYLFNGQANWYNYDVGGDPRIRACLVF